MITQIIINAIRLITNKDKKKKTKKQLKNKKCFSRWINVFSKWAPTWEENKIKISLCQKVKSFESQNNDKIKTLS